MSIKGQTTTLAERVEIAEHWETGQTDLQIAILLERPIATIRKWRRRYQHQGRGGLSRKWEDQLKKRWVSFLRMFPKRSPR